MENGTYYKFALKRFPKSKKEMFENEKRVSNALRGQDGVVQYIGWFQTQEKQSDNTSMECYNLVLEHGKCDLYTVINTRSPPVSPQNYKDLWESMLHVACALKTIHCLPIEGIEYNVYVRRNRIEGHANVPSCHGDIKPQNILSINNRFKLADPGEGRIELRKADGKPRTTMTGGTRSYASPEKSRYHSSIGKGEPPDLVLVSDVWSLGCVFSAVATYAVLGKQGFLEYTEIRRNAQSKNDRSDIFHNGTVVLPEVTAWHDYLRTTARKTDTLTASILDIVDKRMLVPYQDRLEASFVVKEMACAINDHDYSQHLTLPGIIEASLQAIHTERLRYKQLESERSSLLTVDDTRQSLEESTEAENDSRANPQSSSEALLSQSALPGIFSLRSGASNIYQTGNHARSPGTLMTTSQGRNVIISSGLPNIFDDEIARARRFKDVTNLWNVYDDLKTKETSLSSLREKFLGRRQSVREKKMRSKNDELGHFFDQRDIVFLADNSATMARHWLQATFAIEILSWRAMGYDDDGMELYFTNPQTLSCVNQSTNQKVEDFKQAMNSASPGQHSHCGIIQKLQWIMSEYNKLMDRQSTAKNKTVIILTDGIWKDVTEIDEFAVDNMIKAQLHLLQDRFEDNKLRDERPFTIQFICFGHDLQGIERLRRLDDDLKKDQFPDLIDTEPVEGDVYKMFLGSISEKHDEEENYFSLASPISPSQYQ